MKLADGRGITFAGKLTSGFALADAVFEILQVALNGAEILLHVSFTLALLAAARSLDALGYKFCRQSELRCVASSPH